MLLLVALLGLAIFAATVALPMTWEAAEDPDVWRPSVDAAEGAIPDAQRMGANDTMAPLAATGDPGAEDVEQDRALNADRVGESAPGQAAALGPCFRTADPIKPFASEATPLIADFDPAMEAIEIAYEGDTPPELRFVETGGTTEVLADGIVVARMSGVTGLDRSHVSLIAA